MKTSPTEKVRDLYDGTADAYAEMMDREIDLPLYADTLARLAVRLANIDGPIVDTSFGSGHMLQRYRERFDPQRALMGIDLSPRMVEIASARLGDNAQISLGDMRDLGHIESSTAASVWSFFALHHLDAEEAPTAFAEWARILRPGGQLLAAAWEGAGAIDYGEASDTVALRYTQQQIVEWAERAALAIVRCVVEPVEDMPMDAVYVEAFRA